MRAETMQPEAATVIRCDHCTLPVPSGLVAEGAEHQFCCSACRTVYETIHACGMSSYYRLRDEDPREAQQASHAGRGYDEFDDPAFIEKHATIEPDGTRRIELYLEGVHCAACVWLVEKLPTILDGVVDARLDIGRSLATVRWDQGLSLSRIARTLDKLGYPPHPAKGRQAREARRREDRATLIRIAAAGACAGNIMLLSFALYSGMFSGMQSTFETFFRVTSMVIGLVALLWPGGVFYRGAIGALRGRHLNLDIPVALGLSIAAIAGVVNTVRGTGEIYFDSIAMLIFLLLVGRWVQRRRQRAASDAVEMLYSLSPTAARLILPEGPRDVPIETVRVGDIVEVLAGDSVPVDGIVTQGDSSVDASILTGEARPIDVGPESIVSAGSVNLASTIRVRATSAGDDSRLIRLMDTIERLSTRSSRIITGADRLAGWFVIAVVALALITLTAWLIINPAHAVDNAVALLIVTCPCALALATPLAATVAIGNAARRGILIKGIDAIERLAAPTTLFLDKTGTITEGAPSLVSFEGDESVLPLVASIESAATHPIARALTSHDAPAPDEAEQIASRGMIGRVDDRRLVIGTQTLMDEQGIEVPDWAMNAAFGAARQALTPTLIAVDGELVGVAGIGDAPRADAREAIGTLNRDGWTLGILSGDHEEVVRAIAAEVGIDRAEATCSPEDKLAIVTDARQHGPVVMVGDGVNDAAALAEADVGIAVHAGAEASLAAADIYLRRPGLTPLTELIDASRRTMWAIRRNIGVSLAYNAVAASLAMTGFISPLAAAILMPISSFTVLAMSLHARPFGGARWR